jgi:hypothetical protein
LDEEQDEERGEKKREQERSREWQQKDQPSHALALVAYRGGSKWWSAQSAEALT